MSCVAPRSHSLHCFENKEILSTSSIDLEHFVMSVAFWSVDVTSKKAVEVQPPEGYVLNLQLAALSSGKEKTVVKASTLAIEGDEITATLCTLKPNTCDQFTLALVFGYDVPVKFFGYS